MKPRVEYRSYCLPFLRPVQTAHGLWRERRGVLARWVGGRDEAGGAERAAAATSAVARSATSGVAQSATSGVAQSVHYAESAPLPHLSLGKTGGANPFLANRAIPEPKDFSPREVAALLPAGRAALAVLRERRSEGFRTFKWKVGVATDPAEELDILEELCAELAATRPVAVSNALRDSETGEQHEPAIMPAVIHRGGRLRLDANGGWTQRAAEQWLTRCAESRFAAQIEFVEQPVWAGPNPTEAERRRVDDVLRGLSADYPTPIALDESVAGEGEVREWLERGWRGVFVIKPTLLAEPGAVLAELARAKARVVFSSAMETAVGAKAALRWAFAWEGQEGDNGAGVRYALGFGVYPLFRDAVFNGPRAVPFLCWEDVEAIDEEGLWNALC